MTDVDLVVIGGGPAGLAAAIAAKEEGIEDILILEREHSPGGILNQCIHNGFGLHMFSKELTGPEYASRYIKRAKELAIPIKLDTMVLSLTESKEILAVNGEGLLELRARAVILAMGCRERSRGALNIPGDRPVGVWTAGTAQKFVNIDGYMPGREVVILGSGDIGLIMARRMTLEGAKVKAVLELMPHSSGLKRNIVQCLDDYGIPLRLSHTVTQIIGKERLEGVRVAQVDENLRPILETETLIPCDTLLLSVGLLPENELTKQAHIQLSSVTSGAVVGESLQTSAAGIFACGNVLHVHDLVDFVSEESALAGKNAARYIKGAHFPGGGMEVRGKGGVRYTVPFRINAGNISDQLALRFRVSNVYRGKYISVYFDDDRVLHRKTRILTPGEMNTVVLKKEMFDRNPDAEAVTVTIEEA